MSKKPVVVERADWATKEGLWHGNLEGRTIGTDATLLFVTAEKVGDGPRWHVHPYDELFIIRTGRALFTIGEDKIEAKEGDILLGPAGVPHKYANLGPGLLESIDIHLSDRWIQEDLDDPELG